MTWNSYVVLLDSHRCSGLDRGLAHLLLRTSTGFSTFLFGLFSPFTGENQDIPAARSCLTLQQNQLTWQYSQSSSGMLLPADACWVQQWPPLASPPTLPGVTSFSPFIHTYCWPYFIAHKLLPRSFWPKGELGGLPVMGLALGDYKLMPRWIWIYCLVWWFIQVGRCP
jgi:hypothetical protein